MVGGEKVKFTFASDALAKGLLPIKASLTAPGEMGKADFDGRLNFAGAAELLQARSRRRGRPRPDPGRRKPRSWRGSTVWRRKMLLPRLGEGPLADKMSGKASYAAASGEINARSRIAPSGRGLGGGFFAPLLADHANPLVARLNVETLDWRGVEWSQLRLDLTPGAPIHVRAQGPGGSEAKISAAPERQNWRGKAAFKAEDFPGFRRRLAGRRGPGGVAIQ